MSHSELPLFDFIPESVYETTPVPESEIDCNQMMAVLKKEIEDIGVQLEMSPGENAHWFDGDVSQQRRWRYKTHQALRIKKDQLFLLREWKKQHYPAGSREQEMTLADLRKEVKELKVALSHLIWLFIDMTGSRSQGYEEAKIDELLEVFTRLRESAGRKLPKNLEERKQGAIETLRQFHALMSEVELKDER